jgi:hypothetical protein
MEQSGKRITAQKSMQTSIIETSLCKFPCTLLHCLLSHTHNHRLCVKGIHLNLYRLHSPAAEALPCSGLPKLASAPGAMNTIPSALWCVARSAPSCCPHIACHTHTHSTSDYIRLLPLYSKRIWFAATSSQPHVEIKHRSPHTSFLQTAYAQQDMPCTSRPIMFCRYKQPSRLRSSHSPPSPCRLLTVYLIDGC